MGKENIYARLMKEINNAYGVCGLLGNIRAESNFNSINVQNSYEGRLGMNDANYTKAVDNGSYTRFAKDSAGYGLCQWTSSGRKASLLAFAKERGKSIGDENMQVDFLLYELNTSYKGVMKVLKNAKSVKEASDVVVTKFERPKDQSASALNRRAIYGEALYKELVKKNTGTKNVSVTVEMPTIERGSKGKAVEIWQVIIGAKVDGDFGPDTERLTKVFQDDHGLLIDGIVGKNSWKAGLESV